MNREHFRVLRMCAKTRLRFGCPLVKSQPPCSKRPTQVARPGDRQMTRELSYLENCYVESLDAGHDALGSRTATSVSQRTLISLSAAAAGRAFIRLAG